MVWERALSLRNPWIQQMEQYKTPEALDRNFVKKYIEQVVVTFLGDRQAEISLTMKTEEWKQMLERIELEGTDDGTKSRKNLLQPEQATVSVQFPELDEEKIPTAIYGRLSVEDDEDNESMETQIALVQDFINRSSELNYVDTYFDNGFTGTNFKRPAFTRLMNDVRQKKSSVSL